MRPMALPMAPPLVAMGPSRPAEPPLPAVPPLPASPTYADGSAVPVSAMTTEELAAAAGAFPAPQPAKLPTYTPEQLDAMSDLERSIAQTSAAPAPEQPGLSYEGVPSIEESHAEMKLKEELRDEAAKRTGLPMLKTKKAWGQS